MPGPTKMQPILDMTPAEVQAGLRSGRVFLVDVREPAEYAAERIHGAFLYPLSTFDPKALPNDGDRLLVFHCGSGKRSQTAIGLCQQDGLDHHRHLAGGIMSWKVAGLPVIGIDPATGRPREK
ncbi:rhodanese-like domain-containing protein [Ferrovibrio sp.]|uniref:rhodanese-like domain-containing protein n=1 Tax=Ferrovibrio sp. TaxID=1917215 RepID=UPI0026186732|nr:rhodanese-like domain-containing protein [Ferrovibrio sp.]